MRRTLGIPQHRHSFSNRQHPPLQLRRTKVTEQPKSDQLTTEWAKLARAEIDQTIPKATEYGQQSLINLGNQLAQLQGRQVTDAQAMELACWSYLNGKIQRFNDAVINGKQVSDDTLLDIGVYVRMIQIIRKTGNWVGQ